jgi:hypothetical protein
MPDIGWKPERRYQLARLVVLGSFLTIFLLVATLLSIAQVGNANASSIAEKTFNTILPVLAGWVGTVLAFYFSAHSQERTSDSLDKAILHAGGAGTTVAEAMRPMNEIKELIDFNKEKVDDLTLKQLQERFSKSADGGSVSRLIFVDKGVFRYILHAATLDAFLVRRTGTSAAQQAAPSTQPAAATTQEAAEKSKFADLRADAESLRQMTKLVVFVAATATLADAKTALDRVAGAQDIIVTATGNASEAMLGWISNVRLVKELQGT